MIRNFWCKIGLHKWLVEELKESENGFVHCKTCGKGIMFW